MMCPFCKIVACYERQVARRFATGTLAISEENARRLVDMAGAIQAVTRVTLRRVEDEAVPILLCNLFGGLAEGLMKELSGKLVPPTRKHPPHVPFRAGKHPCDRKRKARRAG
jgi:hypothetical protein